eukprot:3632398-Amphidinium_carterae.1
MNLFCGLRERVHRYRDKKQRPSNSLSATPSPTSRLTLVPQRRSTRKTVEMTDGYLKEAHARATSVDESPRC